MKQNELAKVIPGDIRHLDLSRRTYYVLRNWGGIKSLAELARCHKDDLLAIRDFGPVSLAEVRKALKEFGLHLLGEL